MDYLALTSGTAAWLLGKAGLLDALYQVLTEDLDRLRDAELVEGPLRLSASSSGEVLALWNVDYLGSSGDEGWGMLRLAGEYGLLSAPEIGREVLEREIYVISQRLEGLLIDGAFIHRVLADDTHTCLAGRGNAARQSSVGYVERDVTYGATSLHVVLIVGPSEDFARLRHGTTAAAGRAGVLLADARQLTDPNRKKPSLPSSEYKQFRGAVSGYTVSDSHEGEYGQVSVNTGTHAIPDRDIYRTTGWTYRDWVSESSPLSPVQRRLLQSDAIARHPIRITGPAGSGKTLLVQLLTLRRLEMARDMGVPARVLYLVHNEKMAETVRHRMSVLVGAGVDLVDEQRTFEVRTLAEHGRLQLSLDQSQIIDPDAQQAKEFQLGVLTTALELAIEQSPEVVAASPLLRELHYNPVLQPLFVRLVMVEVSAAIKGHGLANDERRYVESERALSRLHGVMTVPERKVIFAAFRLYQKQMFDDYGVLDTDDVALSLLGKLRTPMWDLRRRDLGFDTVFIDETQLFNENERRVLPLLTKTMQPYVPIVLAMDQAQDVYAQSTAGLATLGLAGLANESLTSIHRSTEQIVRLAFFIIQRSTDLFGADFPDFTKSLEGLSHTETEVGPKPKLEMAPQTQEDFGRFVVKRIRALRKANYRRIACVCFSEIYWGQVLQELRSSDLPLHVLENRGERLSPTEPVVVVTRPAHIGGQEFDAVILVGAEEGLFPPRVMDNDALASAVEQQSLRELYLAVTRARWQVVIAINRGAVASPVLEEARKAELIEIGGTPH